jgi:hypothetical protein
MLQHLTVLSDPQHQQQDPAASLHIEDVRYNSTASLRIPLQGLVPLGTAGIVLPIAIAGVMFANVSAAFGNVSGGRQQGEFLDMSPKLASSHVCCIAGVYARLLDLQRPGVSCHSTKNSGG